MKQSVADFRISKKTRTLYVVLLGILVFLFSLLFPFLDTLEGKFIDLRFALRGSQRPFEEVVLVAIDDPSFREMNIRWPWPREIIARGIDKIEEAGAKTIAVDIALSEQSRDPSQDFSLETALDRAGNVVLPSKFEIIRREGFLQTYYNAPIPLFENSAAGTGYINLFQDGDGKVRRLILFQDFNGFRYYPFSLAAAAHYRGTSPAELRVPSSEGRSMLINYAGPDGTYPTISFYTILQDDFDAAQLQDKVVILGATFKEAHDRIQTPFFRGDAMAGMEVHANALGTVLAEDYLVGLSPLADTGILLLLSLLALLLFTRVKPLAGLGLLGGVLVFIIAVGWLFFSTAGIVIEMAGPITAVLLMYLGMMVFHYLVEERSNQYVRNIFSRFVSHQVVDKVLAGGEGVALGGELREVTLFFSDIRGFTTLSEQLDPEEVVGLLNRYFEAMSDIIFTHEGTLNKFIGDAIMAFWGAPIYQEDSSLRAVKASLEMRERLEELNREWKLEDRGPLRIGMGIHRSKVLVGNIGSSKQMEYTVIGDGVNVASRIESLTKELECDILISDSVYQDMRDRVEVTSHEGVAVKGRLEKITVHAFHGWKG